MVSRSLRRQVRIHLHLTCKSLAVDIEHELTIPNQLLFFILHLFSINLTLLLLFLLWLARLGSAGLHLTKEKDTDNRLPQTMGAVFPCPCRPPSLVPDH